MKWVEREREREIDRQREGQRERQREIQREIQRQREEIGRGKKGKTKQTEVYCCIYVYRCRFMERERETLQR